MAFWLCDAREGQDSDWIQRFDPRFWTIDFPHPMMASAVVIAPDALRIDAVFMAAGDLAGLIWDSEDKLDHPLMAYRTDRDYTGATLSFRWRSSGLVPLDGVNGPTLTVEGRDPAGSPRTWYVRLWNYATGTGEDALVSLPFRTLAAGWEAGGEPVHPAAIDRLFISLVPPSHVPGSTTPLAAPAEAWAEMTEIACTGARSMLEIGDVLIPAHGLACATAYDDSCNQTPQRLVRALRGLGYRPGPSAGPRSAGAGSTGGWHWAHPSCAAGWGCADRQAAPFRGFRTPGAAPSATVRQIPDPPGGCDRRGWERFRPHGPRRLRLTFRPARPGNRSANGDCGVYRPLRAAARGS